MVDDEELREKLAKVEALFRRAGSPGERTAAAAAMERLHGRLADPDGSREPEVELQFSLPDAWSVSLFVAVCRKHGVRPYRYRRQRRTRAVSTGSGPAAPTLQGRRRWRAAAIRMVGPPSSADLAAPADGNGTITPVAPAGGT